MVCTRRPIGYDQRMDPLTLVLIAVGLSMDAFAVSITSGIAMKRLHLGHALRIAFFFGAFQLLMPILGWLAGVSLKEFITSWDHWIAFVLLAWIGGKMVYEAVKGDTCERASSEPLALLELLMLSVATSIDALAIGLSLSFLGVAIAGPALVIGLITFAISFLGVVLGDRLGCLMGKRMEIVGGVILIGIGVKILWEHLG